MLNSIIRPIVKDINSCLINGYIPIPDYTAAAAAYDFSLLGSGHSNVSEVPDLSGNGNTLKQDTTSVKPSRHSNLNGHTVLKFNNDFMETDSEVTGIRTVIIVTDAVNGSDDSSSVSPLFSDAQGSAEHVFIQVNVTDGNYDISVDGGSGTTATARWNGNAGVNGANIDLGNTNAENEGPSIWSIAFDTPVGFQHLGRCNSFFWQKIQNSCRCLT